MDQSLCYDAEPNTPKVDEMDGDCQTTSPWVAIQASQCAGRVDRILAVKNPGVSLHPSYENGGREAPLGTIAVLLQDIPEEKGRLLIRYPDLDRTMYWVSLVGIKETCCVSFFEQKLLNFKHCADHRLAPCRGLISGRSYNPSVYKCAIQCISPL